MTMVGATLQGALNATGQFAGHKAQAPQMGFSDILARMPVQHAKRLSTTLIAKNASAADETGTGKVHAKHTEKTNISSPTRITANQAPPKFVGAIAGGNDTMKSAIPLASLGFSTIFARTSQMPAETKVRAPSYLSQNAMKLVSDQRAVSQFSLTLLPSPTGGIQILIRKLGIADAQDVEQAEQLSFLLARSGYRLAGFIINGYAYGAAKHSAAGDD